MIMDSSITCDHCSHANEKDSRFCSMCGCSLDQDTKTLVDQAKPEIELCVKEARRQIDVNMIDARQEAFKWVQQESVKWAKLQFVIVAVAVAVITIVLSIAGFKGMSASGAFQSLVDKADEKIETSLKSIDSTYVEFNNKSEMAMKKLDDKTEELNKLNIKQIKSYRDELISQQKEYSELRTVLKENFNRLDEVMKQAIKLKNANFKIELHYRDDTVKKRNKNILLIKDALSKDGYVISDKKIANLKADKQEIISYTQNDYKISEEIKDLISGVYPDIELNIEPYDYTNENNILIKLCQKINKDTNECIY